MAIKPRQTLDILGRNWRVYFVKSKLRIADGTECDGYTLKDKHLIKVSLNLAKDRQRSTLLHEVLHAIIDMTSSVHHQDEERCIQALESGLFPVLRSPHNVWLINFLLETE